MSKLIDKLYEKSPIMLQELALNGYALRIHLERFGQKFHDLLKYWHETEWFSYSDLIELQNEKLRDLIKHAYETVPYYHRIMSDRKLSPDDFRTVQDLYKLPVLSRDDVRLNLEDLISTKYNKNELRHGHTSGTTGSPLHFFWDKYSCLVNNVVDWRQKNWAGLKYGDKHAVILGRTIVPASQGKPPFWRMNYLHNQLWFSAFHMTDENLEFYINKLEQFNPVIIEGYPSTMFILARYLASHNKTLSLKAVLTSSETLHEAQREIIEKVFCCRVFDFYGLAERTIFTTECDKHSGHHINMEYGILELLNNSDEPVGNNKMGKMVGTSLHNYGMPFIRYASNDISSILSGNCSCGRKFPLMSDVTTKAEDIIITPSGQFISPSILTHSFKPLNGIESSQIIQENINNIIIKIVCTPEYTKENTNLLINAMKKKLGEEMNIKIQFVGSIPRTSSGKFRWVISKVPLQL
ncbi:MAG: phenylacetate--CoA ligase family protein [Candidatus Brocadiaceae bacterium]|nr:phenylacetate--CoA ligase family protein [Candidatus Brocadiaceae bacterium]